MKTPDRNGSDLNGLQRTNTPADHTAAPDSASDNDPAPAENPYVKSESSPHPHADPDSGVDKPAKSSKRTVRQVIFFVLLAAALVVQMFLSRTAFAGGCRWGMETCTRSCSEQMKRTRVVDTKDEYDSKGRVKRSTEYNTYDQVVRYTDYEYDDHDNRISEKRYNANGELTRTKEYDYDASGNMTEERIINAKGEITERRVCSYYTAGTIKQEIVYNEKGNLSKVVDYHENGKHSLVTEFNDFGKVTRLTRYDESGRIIEDSTTSR